MIDSLFTFIRITSLISGSYLGYINSHYIEKITNIPTIKPFKPDFTKSINITEDKFNKMISSSLGLLVGNYAWFIIIPVTVYTIDKQYGKNIRKIVNEINKK